MRISLPNKKQASLQFLCNSPAQLFFLTIAFGQLLPAPNLSWVEKTKMFLIIIFCIVDFLILWPFDFFFWIFPEHKKLFQIYFLKKHYFLDFHF